MISWTTKGLVTTRQRSPSKHAYCSTAEGASTALSIKPVPSVYSAAISSAQWAELRTAFQADMADKIPFTVKRVHFLDEEAIILEGRLEYEAFNKAVREATAKHDQNRDNMAELEETQTKLRQQLVEIDRQLANVTSYAESPHRAATVVKKSARALAASRRRPGSPGTSARTPFQDRVLAPPGPWPSPRIFHDVIFPPLYVVRAPPSGRSVHGFLFSDFLRHVQHATGRSKRLSVHSASQALRDNFVEIGV